MTTKEYAKDLIDQVSDDKMIYIITYLQGALIPTESPNQETIEAIKEVDHMIATNSGESFSGSTHDFLSMLLEE